MLLANSGLSLKTCSIYWFMDDPMRLTTWAPDAAGNPVYTTYSIKKVNSKKQIWYFYHSDDTREEYTMVRE